MGRLYTPQPGLAARGLRLSKLRRKKVQAHSLAFPGFLVEGLGFRRLGFGPAGAQFCRISEGEILLLGVKTCVALFIRHRRTLVADVGGVIPINVSSLRPLYSFMPAWERALHRGACMPSFCKTAKSRHFQV